MFKKLLFLSAFLVLTGVACSNKELMPPLPDLSVSPPSPLPPSTQQSAKLQILEPIMVPPKDEDSARQASLTALKLALRAQKPAMIPNALSVSDLAMASSSIAKLRLRTTNKKLSGWAVPTSTERWLPITIRGGKTLPAPICNIYAYEFSTDKLNNVDNNIVNSADYTFVKNYVSDPILVSAPDFTSSAFVDPAERLYLIANNGTKKSLIYEGNKYLKLSINTFLPRNAWSADSKKLLFSTFKFTGEYDIGAEPVFEENEYKIFNISDGSLTTFPANMGVTVEKFIDNDHLLVDIFVNKKPDFYFITTVLNLNTMQLDQGWYEENFGLIESFIKKELPLAGVVGRYYSLQNSKYVYNIREQAREDYTNLPLELFREGRTIFIYGDYYNKAESTVIASGKFEQYQNPLISPAGNKVAYEEVFSPKLTNQPPDKTILWVYDPTTGGQRSYKYENDVKIIKWLNNDKLFFAIYSQFANATLFPDSYNVLDTSTNLVKRVWERPAGFGE